MFACEVFLVFACILNIRMISFLFFFLNFQVLSEYRARGMDFILQAINHPTYLEDLTGLTELMKSASSFKLDWDNESDVDDEDLVEI